jgi:broad specificity phosphatase PhoE
MKVHIYFIRHAFSCTNMLSRYNGPLKQLRKILYRDPPLTTHGLETASIMGKNIRFDKVDDYGGMDLVCSSPMLRAIQTAALVFPERKIHVLPHIKETGLTLDNAVSSIEYQEKIMHMSGIDTERINYTFVTKFDGRRKKRTMTDVAKNNTSYEAFLQFIGTYIEDLLEQTGKGDEIIKRGVFRMAVVSHSSYMKKNLFHGQLRVENLAVVRMCYQMKAGQVKLEQNDHMRGGVFELTPYEDEEEEHRILLFKGFTPLTRDIYTKIYGKSDKYCEYDL